MASFLTSEQGLHPDAGAVIAAAHSTSPEVTTRIESQVVLISSQSIASIPREDSFTYNKRDCGTANPSSSLDLWGKNQDVSSLLSEVAVALQRHQKDIRRPESVYYKPVVCTNSNSFLSRVLRALHEAALHRMTRERAEHLLRLFSPDILASSDAVGFKMSEAPLDSNAVDTIGDHLYKLNRGTEFKRPMVYSNFIDWTTAVSEHDPNSLEVIQWHQGFHNAIFERSVRRNPKQPKARPYWLVGTWHGRTNWLKNTTPHLMRTAHLSINASVAQLSDEDSLNEAKSILAGDCLRATDSEDELQFFIPGGFGNTIRDFVRKNHQFLIDIVLNNDLEMKLNPFATNKNNAATGTSHDLDPMRYVDEVVVFTTEQNDIPKTTSQDFIDSRQRVRDEKSCANEVAMRTKEQKDISKTTSANFGNNSSKAQKGISLPISPAVKGKNYLKNVKKREREKAKKHNSRMSEANEDQDQNNADAADDSSEGSD